MEERRKKVDKLKYIRVQRPDGTYSNNVPIGVDDKNVDMSGGTNLRETMLDMTRSINSINNTLQGLQSTKVGRDQLGSPRIARTPSAMIDTDAIYVYVGQSDGQYVNGNWYAYDPTEQAWTSGGIYNSQVIATDKSLSIADMAADAGAVGDDLLEIRQRLQNVTIDVDDLGLYQDPDTGYVYPTYQSNVSENGIPLASSGGGGGGGGADINNAVFSASNTTGWLAKTIARGTECRVSVTWSSLEDDISTGNGAARITVNNVVKGTIEVQQGEISIDVSPYLTVGSNTVKVRISDIYNNGQTISFNITVADFSISSTFTTTTPFTEEIVFPFVPVGQAQKTVYFILDGVQLGTLQTTASNRQLTYKIPPRTHGGHTLRCYFEVELNESTIKSNQLYFEFMFVEENNNSTIITSSFNTTSIDQFSSVVIPYKVYSPIATQVEVELYLNNNLLSTQTAGQEEQSFTFRANTVGTNTFKIQSGNVSKTITFTVNESTISINPVSEDLALYLNPTGRSNNQALQLRTRWSYQDITATLTGFNWKIDGWMQDNDGIAVLRTSGGARIQIPYKIFERDFKTTGKTIEIEFATRNVSNYESTIISCLEGNVGLKLTPQEVSFQGAQRSLSQLYKDNEHIRISFVIEKQTLESRLILIYINGVMSRAVQYAQGERFTQLNPVGITIGSDDCDVDIYNIRIYDNDLSRRQILDNWIADTQIGSVLLDRYTHNSVYDEYDNITTSNLPNDLPYMILEAQELPTYKGDKKTIRGSYTDPVTPSKSFTFEGCEIDVQGTSSSVYFRKNYDMKFKQGFITSSGTINNYGLRPNSIPFNRFVIKADVASSESTNNTGLTMFYNDTCPYKFPEKVANDNVRWGIEGVPIVVFWFNPDDQTTQFLGKYNFNLPKRAAAPYGYSGDAESWEVQWNNTANVKFQDDDFTTEKRDEINQKTYPAWYDDFEARFPSDEWRDISKLKEFVSWVKSTWRDTATDETFAEPITYRLSTTTSVNGYPEDESYTVTPIQSGGITTAYDITFTKDTEAYRLTKFRAEFPDYAEVQSATFYYLFTEFFLMIDSWAKNMFIGFHGSEINDQNRFMDRKVVFEPYDMDTAIGTNNSGVLMFGYYHESTDTVSSIISGGDSGGKQTPVFNAQDSVLWSNFRDSFRPEIVAMYSSLRASTWSYRVIEEMYERHQAKWPEAIFNEDSYVKYLYPVDHAVTVDPITGDYVKTTDYLTMLQGSKEQQRKWWLYNRFRYMDSKYNVGDAANNALSIRLFNKSTLSITPAIDMYTAVRFGLGSTPLVKRTFANDTSTFTYNGDTSVQEFETAIYSGDMITDLGDLSVFYPNEVKFAAAARLKRLQLGNADSNYSNTNLNDLNISNSPLLEYLDVRNCPNLKITLNLEKSTRLKQAYFEGSAITGVDLADGCLIEKLHLPATVTALTLVDLNNLSDFVIPSYSNITRLILSNIDSSVVNPLTVLQQLPQHALVNIQGLDFNAANKAEIDTLYGLLDTMHGVTREKNSSGIWIYTEYENAKTTVSGTIHVPALTGAQIAAYQERYPYITIDAAGVSSIVTYKTYDGSSVITTEEVVKNEQNPHPNATYSGSPSRTSTAQYNYTFAGWSTTANGSAQANAQQDIQGDRTLYAAYTSSIRTYTVYFVKSSDDGGGTLQTLNNVAYGTTLTNSSYTGATPTTTQGSAQDYPFEGWTPAFSAITGDTTYTAKFGSPVEVAEISDSWDTIIANIDNGTYKTAYKIGNYKPLDLGTEGTINMQIVAIDGDELADGSGYAPLTFLGMELLNKTYLMSTNGNTGGWPATRMRTYLNDTIKPLIPSNVKARLNRVNKTYYSQSDEAILVSVDDLWIPSVREILGDNSYENSGVYYAAIYKDVSSRIKNLAGVASLWWLRSAYVNSLYNFRSVGTGGSIGNRTASGMLGVCLGFCLGLESETITDSWETILTNPDYATDYAIGDTKKLSINGTDHLMQIVAFNSDVKSDGSGNAKITWLEKDLYSSAQYRMNATGDNIGGWPATEMRSWLRGTILPTIPEIVRNKIVEVNKTYYDYNGGSGITSTQADTIWIPSAKEIFGGASYESSGVDYTTLFNSNAARKKKINGTAGTWWLRSAYSGSTYGFRYVLSYGGADYGNASFTRGVCIGFCTD